MNIPQFEGQIKSYGDAWYPVISIDWEKGVVVLAIVVTTQSQIGDIPAGSEYIERESRDFDEVNIRSTE